jgi:methylated-DNA-[protein]-cysteine S-methyltransferase
MAQSITHKGFIMKGIYTAFYHSPIGIIKIISNETHLLSLSIVTKLTKGTKVSKPLLLCLKQIDEYFLGQRNNFDLPLKLEGTPFEKMVWKELQKIPFGKVLSYKELATKVRKPKAFRAVGNANSKNNFPIIIPCHRVIASNGTLGGYALGLTRKKKLLTHEVDTLDMGQNYIKIKQT